MRELFEMIDASKDDFDTYIELTMVEIYNELIRDLLNDDFPSAPKGGLKLLENEKERVTLDKVTIRRPQSVEEVMELVLLGNQRRSTSFTESNSVSSRSHAVLQINVGRNNRGHEVDFEQGLVRQCTSSATLSIIDLAGSERAAATRNMGDRMKEGANINKSLLALSSCISALCTAPTRGLKPHVPYRNSKLTRMLKFSLGGNCRTVMIVCVSPSSKDIEDTHNTLVWADKAKHVSTKITRNTAGNHVSVQQYLVTIDTQARKILLLEANIAKLEAGTHGLGPWALKKLEAARKEAQTALGHAHTELEASLPVIVDGATQRALWDTAEMRIGSLRRLVEGTSSVFGDSTREKEFLMSLIKQQDGEYRLNNRIQTTVHQEATTAAALERIFKGAEERSFGDAFEARELKAFRLEMNAHRAELAKSVSAAREKGYRESAQMQAENLAQMAALAMRLVATVQEETDLLSGVAQTVPDSDDLTPMVERLRELGSSTDTALAAIFGRSSLAAPLPPLPQVTMSTFPSPSSLPSSSSRSSRQTSGPPRRMSTILTASTSAFRANPAARRLLASAAVQSPGSPNRSARSLASPGKSARRPFRVGHVKGRTPKKEKTFRWRDEAGEGHLDDKSTAPEAPTFSSSSETSGTAAGTGSDEWADETSEEEKHAPVTSSSRLRPRSSLLPLPEWKKNRIQLGKVPGGLSTLGEEGEVFSSPEQSKPAIKIGPMGPPARFNRGPLTERHHVSAVSAVPQVNPNASTSNLLRPTFASASKSLNLLGTDVPQKMGPPARRVSSVGRAPSSSQSGRRVSSSGPYKGSNERRRSRSSMLPGGPNSSILDASMSLSTTDGLPLPSSTALGGGPSRLLRSQTSHHSPESGRPASAIPPNSAVRPFGPRASMSIPSLPRGQVAGFQSLSYRASISSLRSGLGASTSTAGIAGAGDVSTRAAWR